MRSLGSPGYRVKHDKRCLECLGPGVTPDDGSKPARRCYDQRRTGKQILGKAASMTILRALLLVLVALGTAASPELALAQAPPPRVDQTTDCAAITAWFNQIPESDAVNKQLAAAPTDASGTAFVSQYQILNKIASDLKALSNVPAAANQAQTELVAGFSSLAQSWSLWVQGIQSGAPGGIQSLNQMLQINILLSQGRNQVVDGYRLRADLAGGCSSTPATTIGTGCPAVNAWMIPAASYVKGMWDAIKSELQDSQNEKVKEAANPDLINIGGLLAPPETWSNYFFTQALALAELPAPAEAVDVKQQVVAQLMGESDLYVLDMMGIWTGYLGGDAETSQQISDAFAKESNTLSTAFTKLQSDWAALAKSCGSTVLLPTPS